VLATWLESASTLPAVQACVLVAKAVITQLWLMRCLTCSWHCTHTQTHVHTHMHTHTRYPRMRS